MTNLLANVARHAPPGSDVWVVAGARRRHRAHRGVRPGARASHPRTPSGCSSRSCAGRRQPSSRASGSRSAGRSSRPTVARSAVRAHVRRRRDLLVHRSPSTRASAHDHDPRHRRRARDPPDPARRAHGARLRRAARAVGPARGLNVLTTRQPDAVVLDLGLADMDGVELCRTRPRVVRRADHHPVGRGLRAPQGASRSTRAPTTT